jgi:hypothetical protein
MSAALALRPAGAPAAPFGLRSDLVMIEQALGRLDHGHGVDRDLDAEIYAAIGWTVQRSPISRRRIAWRCRSPLALGWEALPCPTEDVGAAARIVPWGWNWGVGCRGLSTGWCREPEARAGRAALYAECNRHSPARALAAAALHGHRQIILRDARIAHQHGEMAHG